MLLGLCLLVLFILLLGGLLLSHRSLRTEQTENHSNDAKNLERASELARRAEHSRDLFTAYEDATEAYHIVRTLTQHRSAEYLKRVTGQPVPQMEMAFKEHSEKLRQELAKQNPNLRKSIPKQRPKRKASEDTSEEEEESSEEEEEEEELFDDAASSVLLNGPLRSYQG